MNYHINGDLRIPQIGLGTFDLKSESILNGLKVGYRLLDTAWQYGNEAEVGKAIKQSGIDRDEIFVTTKLWTEDIRNGRVREEFEDSLKKLKLEYVDMYLIHWPAKGFEKAWQIMCELKAEGKIKNLGVSNFNPHHFETLKNVSDIVPVINQIESHPYFRNREMIDYCEEQGIKVQAWCPLGGAYSNLKYDNTLAEIASKYNKTVAQLILKWHIQRNILIIPRSSNIERLKQNIDIFDFEISEEDMRSINGLDTGCRMGADPDNFNF